MDRNSSRRDVLTRRPITLANAITAALEVEVIEKEQERMEKRMEEPIPSFIPISHHSNETARPKMKEHYLTNTNSVSFIQPVPLATREPPPLLPNMEQLQLVVQQATEGFKEEMTRTVRSLTEQVSYLTKNQNSKAYHESGPHTSGIWCTILGCPNPMGHSSQFCPLLLQQQHKMASPNQYPQQQSIQKPQLYQPPHKAKQPGPNDDSWTQGQHPIHAFCGKRHPVGSCWIENNVVCEKCGGQHSTDKCRKTDKVITLQPPPGDYLQQAQANLQGARRTDSNDVAGPSNLYYDHQNNKQTHTSPSGLQTKQGIIPLTNSQNVRYMDAVLLNNTPEKK